MSWHGNPPQITSGRSKPSPVKVRTSSHFGTVGQCFVSTRRQYSSISTCHTHFIPARSNPRSKPPIPENNEPKVSGIYVSPMKPEPSMAQSSRYVSRRPSTPFKAVQNRIQSLPFRSLNRNTSSSRYRSKWNGATWT